MEYLFRTNGYDVEGLIPEVADALARREEMASRQRLPGMWKATDSLSQKGGAQQPTQGKLLYRKIVGAALIVLGVLMLVPGLREPRELMMCLIAGICGIVIGIHSLWSTRKQSEKRKESPREEAPALTPAVKPTKRHMSTAGTFLENLARVGQTEVRFSEDGMHLGETAVIGYGEIEYFLETRAGYLIAWGRQATFLQKKDLEQADEDGFRSFVENGMGNG